MCHFQALPFATGLASCRKRDSALLPPQATAPHHLSHRHHRHDMSSETEVPIEVVPSTQVATTDARELIGEATDANSILSSRLR